MKEGGERGEETEVEGEMPLLPTTTATIASTKTKSLAAELSTENSISASLVSLRAPSPDLKHRGLVYW